MTDRQPPESTSEAADATVRTSGQKYRMLFDSAPVGIITVGHDGSISEVNNKMLDILGSPSEEATKAINMFDFPPLRQAGISQIFEECIRTGEQSQTETPYTSKWGKQSYLRLLLTPIQDDSGKILGCQGVIEDVTDRKRAEDALRKSEERLRLAMEATNDGVWDWDIRTGEVYRSPGIARMLGYEPDEIPPGFDGWKDKVHPEDVEDVMRELHDYLNGRRDEFEIEFRMISKTGEPRWVLSRASIVERDENGNPVRMAGTHTDIHSRKQAERQLARFFDLPFHFLAVATFDGYFTRLNKTWEQVLGHSEEEMVSRPFLDFVHPDDRELTVQQMAGLSEGRIVIGFENRYRCKDGSYIWLAWSSSPDTERGLVFAVAHDVTDRRRWEEALRESERRYRTLAENFPSGALFLFDKDLRYIHVDGRGLEEAGLRKEDLIGRTVGEVFPPEVTRIVEKHCMPVMEGKASQYEIEFRGRVYDNRAVPVVNDDGRIEEGIVITQDITERKRAEEALRESENRLRAIVEHSTNLFFSHTPEHVITYVSPRTRQFLDCEPEEALVRWTDFATDHPVNKEGIQHTQRAIETGQSQPPYYLELAGKKGRKIWVEVHESPIVADGKTIAIVGSVTDVTERKRNEELMVQTEKYRAVADLAAGVAHNFNNLLQIVIGNANLALLNLQSGDFSDMRENLDQILESSRFGAETVRRLNTFAKARDDAGRESTTVFDFSDLVKQAVEMTRPWWRTEPERSGADVRLTEHLHSVCFVSGRKNELFEVVVNLIKNAAEAIPNDGDISVSTTVRDDYVILRVEDTGAGISPGDLKRVFTPFYTTKEDFGTGLGLATSRTILTQHGGDINVESVLGKGTVFTVRLPIVTAPPESVENRETADTIQGLSILVVDDMDAVLKMLRHGLEKWGHVVHTALSGTESLRLLREVSADVVVCDLAMPDMNGWTVGRELKLICKEKGLPKIPFIILTGWGDQGTETHKIEEAGVDAVVEKPVNISRLLEVIHRVIERSPYR
jgi:PAS domain S-box-containing protein